MIGNDHWTLGLGDLGMADAGDALARLVLTCRPPYAVAVEGKWGSGKTSLMRYAMARLGGAPLATVLRTVKEPVIELPDDLGASWTSLSGRSVRFISEVVKPQLDPPLRNLNERVRIVPIWFNPWQHQSAEQPVVALLQELRQQFTFLLKAGDEVKKLSGVAVEAGLTILGELADALSVLHGGPKVGVGGALSRVRDVSDAYENRHFEGRHDAQRLQLLFEQAVDRLLRPERGSASAFADGRQGLVALRRLVVFVDDLDRCAEAQTVHLLEAIKLYLQTRNCVFVVGMDGAAARRAVGTVLGQDAETSHEYLEKLFQTTFVVPAPRAREGFASKLLEYHGLGGGRGDELAAKVVELVEPNPRKLKSFVAGFKAGWDVHGNGRGDGELDLFLLVHYLRSYHPDVYRLLSYDPGQVGELHTVLNMDLGGVSRAGVSSVGYFFREAFLHAAEEAFKEGEEPQREDVDVVVGRLKRRLDRHKGDRAFVRLWKGRFADSDGVEVEGLLRPFLELQGEGEP